MLSLSKLLRVPEGVEFKVGEGYTIFKIICNTLMEKKNDKWEFSFLLINDLIDNDIEIL